MQAAHYKLWQLCRTFVGETCADRDASHGLQHMEVVTQQAVAIFLMNNSATLSTEDLGNGLLRAIFVGMLHDVCDHKYDKDGTLESKVQWFVSQNAAHLRADGEQQDLENHIVKMTMTAISAISYSKEKKRGMRWFEKEFNDPLWTAARDAVSDADKLEAIGVSGLLRCYEYQCHAAKSDGSLEKAIQQFGRDGIAKHFLLPHVKEHADEKLFHLKDEFIVTPAGKFLAEPLHQDMEVHLDRWLSGAEPLPPCPV